MKVNINNLTFGAFNETGFRSLFKKVITGENIENDPGITITFVGLTRIRKLNCQYRKKDNPTDVLSFGEPDISWPINNKSSIGELIICPRVVEKNAKRYGVTRDEELKRVVIHGALHLLGYDHKKCINDSQEEIYIRQEKYLKSASRLRLIK